MNMKISVYLYFCKKKKKKKKLHLLTHEDLSEMAQNWQTTFTPNLITFHGGLSKMADYIQLADYIHTKS